MSQFDVAPPPLGARMPAVWITICALLIITAAASFLAAIRMGEGLRAWQVYLVNFVFWTGLAFGAVLFSAVLNMTGAKWGRPLKRMAEGFAAYLPVAVVLFWVLYFGREHLFHWVRQPVAEKQVWLNTGFMFARNSAGLLLLTILSAALAYFSVKGDRLWARSTGNGTPLSSNGEGQATSWRLQRKLSPVIAITYAFVLSLVAFDLIMSLDPHWYSTLFGGYYFIGSFYSGVVVLYLLALASMDSRGLRAYISPRLLHDLGKLVLALSLFTGYLFYTQFLVIWYGNLPEETQYVILRVKLSPWEPLAWVVLFMIFLIPFVVLLSRRIKVKRVPMILLSVMILTGMWLERFILVVPSVWKQGNIPIGLLEILVTAGFVGLVALCLMLFLRRVPIVPVSDPLFRQLIAEREERLEP